MTQKQARPTSRRPPARPGQPQGWDRWAPRITQTIGWGGVIFATAFWARTGRESALLVATFAGMAAGGAGLGIYHRWKAVAKALSEPLEELEAPDGEPPTQ